MSAPQSVQKMVYKSSQLGGQGSTEPLKINAWFYGSKCLVTPFTKIKMLFVCREIHFFLLPPCAVVATTVAL